MKRSYLPGIKSFFAVFTFLLITTGNGFSQDAKERVQPGVEIKVKTERDEQGNVILYDSLYSWRMIIGPDSLYGFYNRGKWPGFFNDSLLFQDLFTWPDTFFSFPAFPEIDPDFRFPPGFFPDDSILAPFQWRGFRHEEFIQRMKELREQMDEFMRQHSLPVPCDPRIQPGKKKISGVDI